MRVGVRRPNALESPRARRRRKRKRFFRFVALVFVLAVIAIVAVIVVRERTSRLLEAQAPAPTPTPAVGEVALIDRGAPWSSQAKRAVSVIAAQTFDDPAFPQQTGVVIESARDGTVLYSRNAALSLIPASALKLVVAATALRDLGPSYRFTTRLASDATPQADVVQGSIWFVGSGDPELTSHDLRTAVAALYAKGVRRVTGDIVADGSRFGADEVAPSWHADDLEYGYAAPASAVTLDGGTAQFTITPDANGGAALVSVDPPDIAGTVTGAVRSVSADGENTLRIDPLPGGMGFQVSGDIPYGAPQKYWRSLAHPEQSAADALRAMFIAAGIEVDGDAHVGTAPAGANTLWSKQSRPISLIVRRMAFDSDNHIAEQLVRAVGAQSAGVGTLENGLARERDFLDSIGVSQHGVVLEDASGLSDGNRITARALAAVLRRLATDPDGPYVSGLLPRVGVEGTVRIRDLAPDALGRVLGKDGYITGVSSIAGYVLTRYHGVVIYAFVVNDWDGELDSIWRAEDDLLAKLSAI